MLGRVKGDPVEEAMAEAARVLEKAVTVAARVVEEAMVAGEAVTVRA